MAKLTIYHEGDPDRVKLFVDLTGATYELEDVVSYSLRRPGPAPYEELTVTVLLKPDADPSRDVVDGHQ